MGRVIGSVIAGYLVMFFSVFLTFSVAYLVLGADRAFRPGSYDVSGLWIALSFVLGIGAAFLGGWVCAVVARDPRGPRVLAGLVLALGIAIALPAMMVSAGNPGPRAADVGNLAAMQQAVTPLWITLVNPVIAAATVLMAGRFQQGHAAGNQGPLA